MEITIFLAFGYGILSFLSPCILPLIPVYFASLAGPEIFEDRAKRRLPIFLHALSFVLGFSATFILWGAGSGLLGAALLSRLSLVRQVSGVLLISLGLIMLAAMKIPWLNFQARFNLFSRPARGGYMRSFLVGAVFPVAWIPCTSWVLGGILLLASTSQTAWQGAYLLAVYSLGLGVPFLIMGIAFDLVAPFLKKIRRYSTWLYVASGLLLIAMGILILTDNLKWLPGQF